MIKNLVKSTQKYIKSAFYKQMIIKAFKFVLN